MLQPREGGGNFPHLIKLNILGINGLHKWGGVIFIGSMYFLSSILMLLEWKSGGINSQEHFY